MKVYNDLLLAADEGDVSALCLLDLTAWPLPLTRSTTTSWCPNLNVSLVYVVLSCSGSVHICQTDLALYLRDLF